MGLDFIAEVDQDEHDLFYPEGFVRLEHCNLVPKWAGTHFVVWRFNVDDFKRLHRDGQLPRYEEKLEQMKQKLGTVSEQGRQEVTDNVLDELDLNAKYIAYIEHYIQ